MLTLITALLGGMMSEAAFAVPSSPPAPAVTVPAGVANDDDEFNRQLVEDIAKGAADVEVREAAKAALDSSDPAKILEFLDYGEPAAKKQAAERKRLTAVGNREKLKGWADTGGPNVRAGAKAALDSDDDTKIGDFVAYGKDIAEKLDTQAEQDSKAEQDKITGRVRDMVDHGGPQVQVEGEAILQTGDYERIAEFYKSGYAAANKRDHDYQALIEKALADRNKAIAELTDLAQRSTDAGTARADILRANMQALKLLEDAIRSMQLGTEAARKADQILQEDKPGRAHGQRGRTEDLNGLKATATREAEKAAETARLSDTATAQVQNAASNLEKTGMTNGLDWAKVTMAVGAAAKAVSKASETSQHAVEATLADSLALDANANAQEHADNARKWREEADRQAQAAAVLAEAAKAQEQIAVQAAERAKTQQTVAEDAARKARAHAANARAARINAQGAAANAIDRSNKAVGAYNDAVKAKVREDAAFDRANQAASDLWFALNSCGIKMSYADQAERGLKHARDEATAAGKDADEATRDIGEAAKRARTDANASAAYAERARAAAATANAEANAARAEAQRAKQAAAKADQEAVTARRAVDEANRLTLEAVTAANAAKSAAEHTQNEANAAVDEATQASYQAEVANRAAYAARGASAQIIDPAQRVIEWGTPSSEINADARFALDAAADALEIGSDQAASAQAKAAEADHAAQQARAAAESALAQVKPAFEAVQRAADAAAAAAHSAEVAYNAANNAAQYAHNAHVAANDASQAASAARSEAVHARTAASMASSAAAVAGRAAGAAEKMHAWAIETTANIHAFGIKVDQALGQFYDLKKQQEEAERLKREEAETHQKQLEVNFLTGLANLLDCVPLKQADACAKVGAKAWELGGKAKAALFEYAKNKIDCDLGVEAACVKVRDANNAVKNFVQQAIDGFKEGAVKFGESLVKLAECAPAGPKEAANILACYEIYQGFKQLIAHPLELVHLTEWDQNPGKALGLSLFDLATFAVPYGGGVLLKALDTVGAALSRTIGKFVNSAAKIDYFAIPLANAAGKLAEVLNLGLRIENGIAKVTSGVVKIDGVTFRLETGALRAEGDLAELAGMTARIEGGVIRLDGNIARIDGGVLKVEPVRPSLEPGPAPKPDPWACDSFAANTLVLMADGSVKPISLVAEGDEVANSVPGSGVVERHKVLSKVVTDNDRDFVDLTVAGATVTTTAHHWFWNPARHGWFDAGDLRPGDQLAGTGTNAEVEASRAYSGTMRTYNLSVESVHTFYVVAAGTPMLVHNCSGNILARDEAAFPNLAHTLKEHVNVTEREAVDLAKEKNRKNPNNDSNSVYLDQVTAEQVVDYALANNATKINNWLRKNEMQRLEFTGSFGANNPIGWIAKADGRILDSGNRFYIMLQRQKGYPNGYYVYTSYPK